MLPVELRRDVCLPGHPAKPILKSSMVIDDLLCEFSDLLVLRPIKRHLADTNLEQVHECGLFNKVAIANFLGGAAGFRALLLLLVGLLLLAGLSLVFTAVLSLHRTGCGQSGHKSCCTKQHR